MPSDKTRLLFHRGDSEPVALDTRIDDAELVTTDPTILALKDFNTDGLMTQTAADTFTAREIIAPAAGVTVSDGDGVAGNPTLGLANDLAALEALSGTNTIYYRSGIDTWSAVTIGSNLTFAAGTLNANAATAATTTFSPAGDIAATDVQAAIEELDAEKQPLDAELTAIAGLTSAADEAPYFTGSGAAALFDLSAYIRTLTGAANAAAARTTLGAAALAVAQTFTGDQRFDDQVSINGAPVGSYWLTLNITDVGLRISTTGSTFSNPAMNFNNGTVSANFTTTTANNFDIGTFSAHDMRFMRGNAAQATVTSTGLNLITGKTLTVNGTQVLAARRTGWTADSGTAKRTANTTYAAGATLTFTDPPTAAEMTALATRLAAVEAALQNASQTIKALKDDSITHGFIGA